MKSIVIVEKLHNKQPVSYAELHGAGITNETALKNAISVNWPKLLPTGVTRRTNVFWKRMKPILNPQDTEAIPDSVWVITWDFYSASRDEKYPHIFGNSYPSDIVDNVSTFETLGWVSAPDIISAKMMAQTMLGSRAHDKINLRRKGVGGWQRANAENKKLLQNCQKLVAGYHKRIQQKLWAVETIEHTLTMVQMLNDYENNNS